MLKNILNDIAAFIYCFSLTLCELLDVEYMYIIDGIIRWEELADTS